MKTTRKIQSLATAGLFAAILSGCTAVSKGPVNPPAPGGSSAQTVSRSSGSKPVPKKTTETTGALRQVPNEPKPEKPKAFPDIPLKEDTGTSPLIITKPDTKPYVRE